MTYVTLTPAETTQVTMHIVPSEHSDQEDCDHVSTCETDGYNLTASDDNDTDSEMGGGGGGGVGEDEAKNGKIWNKLPPLVSHCRKRHIL